MADRTSAGSLIGAVLLVSLLAVAQTHGDDRQEDSAQTVDYVIVVTGGELLAGAYPDAHTAFLTRTLHPLGFRCIWALIVDDAKDEIQQAVRVGLKRTDLVIVCGGLGPTPDDVAREALSELTGIPLREHPDLIANLERRFNTPADQLRANLRRQTQVPQQGGYLANPNGTAVGLVFEPGEQLIVSLPGPPRELQPMVQDELVPRLTARYGTRAPGHLLRLRFVGIGESSIAQTIDQHVVIPEQVTVSSLFEGMRVDFYFTLPGASSEDLARLDQLRDEMLSHLGDYIYATDATTLEEHVVDLLAVRGKTIALAEAGSGGNLAAALSSSSAIADVLLGAYVAPDEQRLWNLLGGPPARSVDVAKSAAAFAERVAEQTGADLSLAIVSARDTPQDGRYVEVAMRYEGQSADQRLTLRGSGDLARFQLTTQLLDLIRRRLR
jgi:nicotinamide-nucleotide amidase